MNTKINYKKHNNLINIQLVKIKMWFVVKFGKYVLVCSGSYTTDPTPLAATTPPPYVSTQTNLCV
jgi:hypothetical protein